MKAYSDEHSLRKSTPSRRESRERLLQPTASLLANQRDRERALGQIKPQDDPWWEKRSGKVLPARLPQFQTTQNISLRMAQMSSRTPPPRKCPSSPSDLESRNQSIQKYAVSNYDHRTDFPPDESENSPGRLNSGVERLDSNQSPHSVFETLTYVTCSESPDGCTRGKRDIPRWETGELYSPGASPRTSSPNIRKHTNFVNCSTPSAGPNRCEGIAFNTPSSSRSPTPEPQIHLIKKTSPFKGSTATRVSVLGVNVSRSRSTSPPPEQPAPASSKLHRCEPERISFQDFFNDSQYHDPKSDLKEYDSDSDSSASSRDINAFYKAPTFGGRSPSVASSRKYFGNTGSGVYPVGDTISHVYDDDEKCFMCCVPS